MSPAAGTPPSGHLAARRGRRPVRRLRALGALPPRAAVTLRPAVGPSLRPRAARAVAPVVRPAGLLAGPPRHGDMAGGLLWVLVVGGVAGGSLCL